MKKDSGLFLHLGFSWHLHFSLLGAVISVCPSEGHGHLSVAVLAFYTHRCEEVSPSIYHLHLGMVVGEELSWMPGSSLIPTGTSISGYSYCAMIGIIYCEDKSHQALTAQRAHTALTRMFLPRVCRLLLKGLWEGTKEGKPIVTRFKFSGRLDA